MKDWAEFIDFSTSLCDGSQRLTKYLFRGQKDSGWSLLPVLARDVQKSIRWTLDREFHMQRIFRSDAHNHLSPPLLPSHTRNVELWWSVMRHYGVPTRLLDWTSSPFVAAYFAVNDVGPTDGCIWVVHPNTVNKIAKEKHSFNGTDFIDKFISEDHSDLIYFFEPAIKSDRMLAQQCWFSVCANPLKEHGIAIESCKSGGSDDVELMKIIIPARQKIDYLKRLVFMNITARTLFPGLDGLGKSLGEFFNIERAL